MQQIDETTVEEHFSLDGSEFCFYVWEYTARRRYDFSPTNHLVSNLKIKPTLIAANPRRDFYKQQAIAHCASALRSLIQRTWVEGQGTFVPLPPSKIPGHPDYDDRVQRILNTAFAGLNADIRPLLEQTVSTAADHESNERLSYAELLAMTRVAEGHAGVAPRANIAVVDDVLNSGKHFKVARELLSQRFPGVPVIGVFIARCVRAPSLGDPMLPAELDLI